MAAGVCEAGACDGCASAQECMMAVRGPSGASVCRKAASQGYEPQTRDGTVGTQDGGVGAQGDGARVCEGDPERGSRLVAAGGWVAGALRAAGAALGHATVNKGGPGHVARERKGRRVRVRTVGARERAWRAHASARRRRRGVARLRTGGKREREASGSARGRQRRAREAAAREGGGGAREGVAHTRRRDMVTQGHGADGRRAGARGVEEQEAGAGVKRTAAQARAAAPRERVGASEGERKRSGMARGRLVAALDGAAGARERARRTREGERVTGEREGRRQQDGVGRVVRCCSGARRTATGGGGCETAAAGVHTAAAGDQTAEGASRRRRGMARRGAQGAYTRRWESLHGEACSTTRRRTEQRDGVGHASYAVATVGRAQQRRAGRLQGGAKVFDAPRGRAWRSVAVQRDTTGHTAARWRSPHALRPLLRRAGRCNGAGGVGREGERGGQNRPGGVQGGDITPLFGSPRGRKYGRGSDRESGGGGVPSEGGGRQEQAQFFGGFMGRECVCGCGRECERECIEDGNGNGNDDESRVMSWRIARATKTLGNSRARLLNSAFAQRQAL
ncbi:hypothetical protein DENSPDRAFT_850850 [Dentipellis sp. KUC8613]|nr:hypothetical protein DENSPDRAFT_850850 [Dentipellis sp. KUC8613]